MNYNLKNIREAIHKMFVAWVVEKLEVCDSETKESWIVKTLDPEHFQEFYDALDLFLRRFEGFEKELRERWETIEKNKQQVLKSPEYLRPLEAIQQTIKEILGE